MVMPNGDVFESTCDMLDVTSNHRPSIGWCLVDVHGHEHRWYVGDQPATVYRPGLKYETPSLVWVKDGEAYWEDDDEPHAVGHLECRLCGEHIQPGYMADTYRQYMPGLRRFRINGVEVLREEFEHRIRKVQAGL
jgi:hypothetical protein